MKELNTIKLIASNNGYSEDLIDKLYHQKQKRLALNLIYTERGKDDDRKWRRIPYLGRISNRTEKLLPKDQVKAAFYNKNTLGKLLGSTKDKISAGEHSGVYKLQCNDCNSCYVGKTGWNFNIRTKEHRSCFINNNQTSHFAKHLLDSDHTSNFEPIILHKENNGPRLDALEQLEILVGQTSPNITLVNEQLYSHHSPLFNVFSEKPLRIPLTTS